MGISRRKKRFNISNLKPYQTSPKINKGIKNDLIDLQSTDNCIHKLDFSHVSHIKELIIATAEKPHIAKRLISTFAFCLLRMNNIKYKKTSEILESIGCCEISVASNWANKLRCNSDKPLLLIEENRKYHGDDFYQIYPEIKAEAMNFARKRMKEKAANFKARDLSKFINSAYTNLTNEIIEEGVFLRSERSCRRDLLKWGTKFEFNKKRPYFEGHERPDVLEYRKKFIESFDIKIKDFGYIQKRDENNKTFLEKSIVRLEDQKKTVLICHD